MTTFLRMRWVYAAVLLLSLALNVYLAGVMMGRSTVRGVTAMGVRHRVEEVVAAAPPEQRAQVRAAIRKALMELRPEFEAVRAAKAHSIDMLEAPTVDSVALEADYLAVRQHTENIQRIIQRTVEQTVAPMSQAQRKLLGEVLRTQLERNSGFLDAMR